MEIKTKNKKNKNKKKLELVAAVSLKVFIRPVYENTLNFVSTKD